MTRFAAPLLLLTVLLPASAHGEAKGSVRATALVKLEKQLSDMRSGVWTARMTGCGGWDCNEATVYFQLPNKIDIRYDKPYGSRVLADGKKLRVYGDAGRTEVSAETLADTPLALFLHGAIDDEVAVSAVEEHDRGTESGEPRFLYEIELENDGRALTLYASRDEFQLLGWKTSSGGGGEFVAQLRDLRAVDVKDKKKLPKDLFRAPKRR